MAEGQAEGQTPGVRSVWVGATLMIVAVIGLVLAIVNHPRLVVGANLDTGNLVPIDRPCGADSSDCLAVGLSKGGQAALLIIFGALMIVGAIRVGIGLINYARRPQAHARLMGSPAAKPAAQSGMPES